MFTSDVVRDFLMGLVRHGATALGGVLVEQGLLMSNQMNDLIGSALFLAGIGWSWWDKRNKGVALARTATSSAIAGAPMVRR